MSKIKDLVDALEDKITIILKKKQALEDTNKELIEQLKFQQQELSKKQDIISSWEEKYNTLKIVNSMLGSDKNKRDTKLKINTLIRDIDHCIAQLSK